MKFCEHEFEETERTVSSVLLPQLHGFLRLKQCVKCGHTERLPLPAEKWGLFREDGMPVFARGDG